MTVLVNFNVRNPEWYWPAKKIRESGDYYEEWKIINKEKIEKHIPTWAYEIAFDVIDVNENRQTQFELLFTDEQNIEDKKSVLLKNVTHIVFNGAENRQEVVVANELLHSYMGAKKEKGKYYWYFFINADTAFERINNSIWITREQFALIETKLKKI